MADRSFASRFAWLLSRRNPSSLQMSEATVEAERVEVGDAADAPVQPRNNS